MSRTVVRSPRAVLPNRSELVGGFRDPGTKAEEADRLALVVEQSTKTLSSALAALERLHRVRAA